MHIRAEQVDRQVKQVSEAEYQYKYNNAKYIISNHTSHLVDNRCDNAGCQSERQKARIGKHIRHPSGNIIQIICAKRQPQDRILLVARRHHQNSQRAHDRHSLCQRIKHRREYDIHLRDGTKQFRRKQHQDQPQKQEVPEYHVADKIHNLAIL